MIFLIRNHFCYKNALKIIFTIKCIENDFYNKNALEMTFTLRIN